MATADRGNVMEANMITDKDIERINELYHKSKAEGLTPAEKEEQMVSDRVYHQFFTDIDGAFL